ncbi:MAG: hypothetical protein ACLFQS_05205, partial [Bacteroidales bacterium]
SVTTTLLILVLRIAKVESFLLTAIFLFNRRKKHGMEYRAKFEALTPVVVFQMNQEVIFEEIYQIKTLLKQFVNDFFYG